MLHYVDMNGEVTVNYTSAETVLAYFLLLFQRVFGGTE